MDISISSSSSSPCTALLSECRRAYLQGKKADILCNTCIGLSGRRNVGIKSLFNLASVSVKNVTIYVSPHACMHIRMMQIHMTG